MVRLLRVSMGMVALSLLAGSSIAGVAGPAILATIPANGATNVPTNAKILIFFSTPMDATSITNGYSPTNPHIFHFTASRHDPAPMAYVGMFHEAGGARVAFLFPRGALAPRTTYTLVVTPGVKDSTGAPMASEYTMSFATGPASDDATPPNFDGAASATALGPTSLRIAWKPAADSAWPASGLYYAVHVSTTEPTGPGPHGGLYSVGIPDSTSAVLEGLWPGRKYHVTVVAFDGSMNGSAAGAAAIAETPPSGAPPPIPSWKETIRPLVCVHCKDCHPGIENRATLLKAGGVPLVSLKAGESWSSSFYTSVRRGGMPIPPAKTTSTYSTPPTRPGDGGRVYRVTISNAAGSVASDGAALTVTAAPEDPDIARQPQDLTVNPTLPGVFTVTARGTLPFFYQWKKNGTDIPGATSPSYAPWPLTPAIRGSSYSVTVTNAAGSVTSRAAILTVSTAPVAPRFVVQPASPMARAGQVITLSGYAVGTEPIAYHWTRNGVTIAGAKGCSYTPPPLTPADDGSVYALVATNSAGSETSVKTTVRVNAAAVAPKITVQPANQTVAAGEAATFSVVASGTEPLIYEWTLKDSPLPPALTAAEIRALKDWVDAGAPDN